MNRRKFFKSIGMLAALPIAAKLFSKDTRGTNKYLEDDSSWTLCATPSEHAHIAYHNGVMIQIGCEEYQYELSKALRGVVRRTGDINPRIWIPEKLVKKYMS